MQQSPAREDERQAAEQARHMAKMRKRADEARQQKRKQAERSAIAEARRQLREAEAALAVLYPRYDRALTRMSSDLEALGARIHTNLAVCRQARKKLEEAGN